MSVSAIDPNAAELALSSGAFMVSRDDTKGALTVSYTVSGKATPGADYITLSGSVTIPDGAKFVGIRVDPLYDTLFEEGTEDVILTIVSGAYKVAQGAASAVVQIVDGLLPPWIDLIVSGTASDPKKELDPGAFVSLNDDFDENNKDAAAKYVPDNQPDKTAGHRIDPDPDPFDTEERDLLDATVTIYGWGKNTWNLTHGAQIKVWREDGGNWVEVESGKDYDHTFPGILPGAKTFTLKIEGLETTALHAVPLKANVTRNGRSDWDKANVTVVNVDVAVDGLSELNEDWEDKYGGLVALNDNYDEGNKTAGGAWARDNQPDNAAGHRIVGTDKQLRSGQVTFESPNTKGKYKLDFPAGIKVWRPQGGGFVEITSGKWSAEETLNKTLDIKIEGITKSAALNDVGLLATFQPSNTTYAMDDEAKLSVVKLDLDVDANRNNIVEDADADEVDEDAWASGAGRKGSLVLPNADDDDGDHIPDNWPGDNVLGGTVDWSAAAATPADTAVNLGPNEDDIDDIGQLVVHEWGIPALPEDAKLKLEVSMPAIAPGVPPESAYFAGTAAKNRVRVFLPSWDDGSNTVIDWFDEEIIGPTKGDSATFAHAPAAGQQDLSLFEGTGKVVFGIEGIEMGAMVDLKITVSQGNTTLTTDTVRAKVSPYVLSNHTQNIATGFGSNVVHVTSGLAGGGVNNTELVDTLSDAVTGYYPGETGTPALTDPWQQDGYEIGYAQAPYGSMPVVLELPRADRWDMRDYTRGPMLTENVGVYVRMADIGWTTYDSGGNMESIPRPGGLPGYFFHGKSMSAGQVGFIRAQGVNPELTDASGATIAVNTNWLLVGHVDEVTSVVPNGKLLVADPEVAWALMLWAAEIDKTATMLDSTAGAPAGGYAVGDVVDTAPGKLGATLRPYNFTTVMNSANLPQVRAAAASALPLAGEPESVPVANAGNTGARTLTKGGAMVGFFGNNNVREYSAWFTGATTYELWWRTAGGAWQYEDDGDTTQDEVFPESGAFLLSHFWGGGAAAAGDEFTFTADPTAGMVEVPVLFTDGGAGKAAAFNIDHVNALVDGNTIFTGRAYGPEVDYEGFGPGFESDILGDYVEAVMTKAGYADVVPVDSRYYHNGVGNIHCGTNAQRDIPNAKWWNV